MILRVEIPGEPIGKGRPRLTTRNGFARAYTPAKTRQWEAYAADIMRQAYAGPPLEEFVAVRLTLVGARPKRMGKKDGGLRMPRRGRQDIDNETKSVLDAMQKAGVLADDSWVWHLTAYKLFATINEQPHVLVEVYRGL